MASRQAWGGWGAYLKVVLGENKFLMATVYNAHRVYLDAELNICSVASIRCYLMVRTCWESLAGKN